MHENVFVGAERVFNARNLTPERVAETFVAPAFFMDLCQGTHTVLMGPRGSGKTTLLKMLTRRALAAWNDPVADRIRSSLSFDAIYIPSDIHWEEQLVSLSYGLLNNPDGKRFERLFSEAAVTLSVLVAVLDALEEAAVHLKMGDAKRHSLLVAISDSWKIEGTPPLIPAMRRALEHRYSELFALFKRLSFVGAEVSPAELPDWIYLDYLAATRAARAGFEEVLPESKDRKWALCFDELELAPVWLQDRVFKELRSTDQRFLYKLSTSPLPELPDEVRAAPLADYDVLRLWPVTKVKRDFSLRLASQVAARRLGEKISLEGIFGRSAVGSSENDSYSDGRTVRVFASLAKKDPSFRAYLVKHGLDPANPTSDVNAVKDQFLRKAKPLAYFRDAWLSHELGGGGRRLRTRKRTALYHGVEDVIDIADGNPRWLIATMNALLTKWAAKSSEGPLSLEGQEEVLSDMSDRYRSFLRTLPDPRKGRHVSYSLHELVEILGEVFQKSLLFNKFSLNPPSTIRVDDRLPEPVIQSLRWAAEQGALIVMDPAESGLDVGIEGRRLRLTFLLAPHFKLPLRVYKAVQLSRVLSDVAGTSHSLLQLNIKYEGRE